MSTTEPATRCGVGIRGVAITVDAVVWFALFFATTLSVAAGTGHLTATADGLTANLDGTPAAIAFTLWLALGLTYHTVFEWWYGKTLGKYLVSIRAARVDGTPLSLHESFSRNVVRLVDFLPVCYLVGIGFLTVSDDNQRLGDRVADTVVVRGD